LDDGSDKFVVPLFPTDSVPDPVHSTASELILRHKLPDCCITSPFLLSIIMEFTTVNYGSKRRCYIYF